MSDIDAARARIENTTQGIGGTTITTGSRVYSPLSQTTGSGVPDAKRVVSGTETTIVSAPAVLGLSALGAVGYAYSQR